MRFLYILIIAVFISCENKQLIIYSGDLKVGVEQSDSLAPEQVKSYQLELDSGTYLYGYVNQLSVDVIVELKNENKESVASFDGPAKGPENFSFEIDQSGIYTLEIKPFEEESGTYSVILLGVEAIASEPEKRVDQLMSFYSGNNPGVSVGVVKDGELIFLKSYGKANLTHDLDFRVDMPTNIGSVSKQFTAMSILLLEQQGKLSLEDDVRIHIPELPDLGEVVRIRNILNHTNGWREVYNLMHITGWDGGDRLLREEVLTILQKQTEFQAAPDEEFNYNNSAFIMAAEIVERVSGQDFPSYVNENIFQPLGMSNSYVRKDPSSIIPEATQGYSNGDFGYVESEDLHAAYGAGAIYTTPVDFAKWLNNFESGKIGGKDVIEKLVTPGILNNGDTMTYALGIGVGEYKGLKRYAHGGADIAHRAMMVYFPKTRSGVIAFSNNASFPRNNAYRIADIFFKNDLAEEIDENEEDTDDEITLSDEVLENYTGKFKAETIGLTIEFKLEDGQLVAYPVGQSSLKMKPTSETSFNYVGIEASIQFVANQEGEYTSATHTQGGSNIEFSRLPPFNPSMEELAEYTGRYFSEELETFYNIVIKDSTLIANHRNMEVITLTPADTDGFSGDIFFLNEVEFKRNSAGNIEGLTVSNGRTKGILFNRL